MYKILTFTPVHERFEILLIFLKGLKRLQKYKPEKFQIRPFLIVSSQEEKEIVESFGFDFMEYKNEPLGEKKNAGLKHIIGWDFDYLMELGSDDLISNDYLDFIEPELKKKTPLFNASTVYFIDTITGRGSKWSSDIVIGLGRCISKDTLRSAFSVKFVFNENLSGPDLTVQRKKEYYLPRKSAEGYKLHGYGEIISEAEAYLWNNTGVRGMDTFSMNTLARFGVYNKILKTDRIFLLDIKSRRGLNAFQMFTPLKSTVQLFKRFPDEAADIKRLIKANNIIPIKRK